MSDVAVSDFERIIRDAGEKWLIDWHSPTDEAIPLLSTRLSEADKRARDRYPHDPPQLSPAALVDEYSRNPHRVRALLQVLGSVGSIDMLVMVARILQGSEIAEIHLDYTYEKSFSLYVRLNSPYDFIEKDEYCSNDIDDAVILRHLGTMKMDGQPIFDGFYPLRR